MLLEEFLEPLGVTQRELADAVGVPCQRVNEIVNGRRSIAKHGPEALAVLRSVEWLLDERSDAMGLYHAQQNEGDEVRRIRPRREAVS